MMAKLSPPWVTYVNELRALFGQDPEIKIEYDEYTVKLFVENPDKADALMALLPSTKEFGEVTLNVLVIPADDSVSFGSLIKTAFMGNPVLVDVINADTPFGSINYVMFKKEVVQFFNDQMDDPYGNKSMLYQDIARNVFGDNLQGTFFCTNKN